MNDQRSVLIVDRSEETREVLQTVLERRGVRTLAAGRTETGLDLARQHHPDLIVLDLEIDDRRPSGCLVPASRSPAMTPQCRPYQPRLVLLGNLRGWRNRMPGGRICAQALSLWPLDS